MASLLTIGLLLGKALAYDTTLAFNSAPAVEKRSLDQIHQAALKEGGVVTLWHGGDEKDQADDVKKAFETRFPGMTLNVTVDLSKYHDVKIDQQLVNNNVYVDSIILQTLQDYPRWAQEGALLNYAPQGFDQIHPAFKDSVSAAWYGTRVFAWSIIWNSDKLPGVKSVLSFQDILKPEFKNKLVLTYPNDDDAVLYGFNLIMQVYGTKWFEALLAQNPRWVRGTATPATVIQQKNSTQAITFTSDLGQQGFGNIKINYPTDTQFVTWPQTGAILKNAPHPEGAKLLHNFLLSSEFQNQQGWSVRQDAKTPKGFPYPDVMHLASSNPTTFLRFMEDRASVERLRFYFEDRLGSAQGLSPLIDDI
ncbi:hypothetical protein PT974_05311 [Cladobotryum mycophilum]|uniref:ABC-type Fe3+ transport system n=1 Tax=Cladobotryum mycophilum TaxID=491253 RepID=A0ABR0SJ94_9HYPO